MGNGTAALMLGEKDRGNRPTVPMNADVRRLDAREMTTMRGLLEWAYQREMVRFAGSGGGAATPSALSMSGRSMTGRVCDILDEGFMSSGGGGWMGSPSSHPDAEHVHGMVLRLEREDYWRVVRAAESGTPPDWDPDLPKLKVVRLLKASGAPRMYVCPVSRRPVAERIAVVGMPLAEAEAIRGKARAEWHRWVQLLTWLRHDLLLQPTALKRWQITAVGADLEPWSQV